MMNNPKYAFQVGKEIKFIDQNEIMYCTADSNYTGIATVGGKKVLTTKSLKNLEKIFNSELWVHNSWIVNVDYVESFSNEKSNTIIMADGKVIQVSRRKKQEFMAKFHKL